MTGLVKNCLSGCIKMRSFYFDLSDLVFAYHTCFCRIKNDTLFGSLRSGSENSVCRPTDRRLVSVQRQNCLIAIGSGSRPYVYQGCAFQPSVEVSIGHMALSSRLRPTGQTT